MNKKVYVLLIGGFLMFCGSGPLFASDWDKAGKILTGIEGLRIITGGKVDVIGSLTGIRNKPQQQVYVYRTGQHHPKVYHHVCSDSCRRWVPNYVWVEKWVPGHLVYAGGFGQRRFVAGHYERYMVEQGGHWVADCPYSANHDYSRR